MSDEPEGSGDGHPRMPVSSLTSDMDNMRKLARAFGRFAWRQFSDRERHQLRRHYRKLRRLGIKRDKARLMNAGFAHDLISQANQLREWGMARVMPHDELTRTYGVIKEVGGR